MVCDSGRHPGQDPAWTDALAVAQLHGLFPRRRHLPEHLGRDVLCRIQRAGLQLALLTGLYGARDHRHGLAGQGARSARVFP